MNENPSAISAVSRTESPDDATGGNSRGSGRRRGAVTLTMLIGVFFVAGGAAVMTRSDDRVRTTTTPTSITASSTSSVLATTTVAPAPVPDHHGFVDGALYVALYGSPLTDSLGVLGEHDVAEAVDAAIDLASDYAPFAPTVVPTFEIITSVASFEAGPDGDYSNESDPELIQPYIDAADDAGVHVILDLQSGRAKFDDQAAEYEELLKYPHVGLALDPEWRAGPDDRPVGGRIGSVTAAEVNRTIALLDRIVEDNDLPPKVLIVHQFVPKMIVNKYAIDDTANVQVIVHMDGFGPLRLKNDSYDLVVSDLPDGALPGWKNFYDEDDPTPTPAETMERDPAPVFVSFQ